MKRFSAVLAAFIMTAAVFAASYTTNTYQKLADEYSKKAQAAFNAGQYDAAVEYSDKAAENAALSKAYIDMMKARHDVDEQMKLAKDKIDWAEKSNIDKTFPMAYALQKNLMPMRKRLTAKKAGWLLSIMQNKRLQPLTELRAGILFRNTISFVLGRKLTIATGILPVVPMFTTIPCYGKICIRLIKIPCRSRKTRTLFYPV